MMALTLLIAALGGAVALLVGIPIPWLLGSLLAVSTLQIAGFKLRRPSKRLERVLRVLIGVTLGASVSSNVSGFNQVLLITILVAIVFVTIITAFGTQFFTRLQGFKVLDGFMSSLPGGLSFLIALSGDLGERFPKIALIQTVRVVTLVFTFTLLALFFHAEITAATLGGSFAIGREHLSWPLLVLIITCLLVAEKAKVAGGHVLFSLILSTLVYQLGWVTTAMPELVKTLAMIIFGGLLGYELSRDPDKSYFKVIVASVVFTLAVMFCAFLLSLPMSHIFDYSYLLFLMALAPGGIAEISLIALALGFDAGFVATVHACRFGFIMIVGPIGLNLALHKENKGDNNA